MPRHNQDIPQLEASFIHLDTLGCGDLRFFSDPVHVTKSFKAKDLLKKNVNDEKCDDISL